MNPRSAYQLEVLIRSDEMDPSRGDAIEKTTGESLKFSMKPEDGERSEER
jgi:hypothetical protein